MLISGIPNQKMNKEQNPPLILRNGQVALGKLTKIYPNNQAEVQVGGHRFIALIERPLSVGEKYLFQVEQRKEQQIQLRVIGDQVQGSGVNQITSLLRQLNLKINDSNITFVQTLIKEDVPFSQKELIDALNLLQRLGNSQNIQTLVKHTLLNNLPLQEGYLRALLAVSNQTMSETMAHTLESLNLNLSTSHMTKLQSLLASLIHAPTVDKLSELPQAQLHSFLQTLQLFNYVKLKNQGAGESQNRPEINVLPIDKSTIENHMNELQNSIRQGAIRVSLGHFITQYKALQQEAINLISQFNLSTETTLKNDEFLSLSKGIKNQILPLLPTNEEKILSRLLTPNKGSNQTYLQAVLHTFASNQFYSILMEALVFHNENTGSVTDLIPQRFMLHLDQILQTLGLSHEAMVKSIPVQQASLPFNMLGINETIKAVLLQVDQDYDAPNEKIKQLVHFISGLQLQAREENNMLHAQLQLPGEKIGLPEDLFIKLEGRKTKENKIDSDFCRILFFLNLHHIEETIIDMNIQKRVITLTVYNENNEILINQMKAFKGVLSEGLQKLNYHLSSVRFKPLEDNELVEVRNVDVNQEARNASFTSQEGFDLRI